MPEMGESDTGFFCWRSARLRSLMDQMRAAGSGMGKGSREFNFLPVIPLAAKEGLVLSPRVMRVEETVGVNSSRDAAGVEEFLRSLHGCQA
jgi:bifunctional N-acetylglucosamine-1-phosphate-uridyltransferase/glucosamine-1-phosphate-acetyltransferase GlmU-like protein